MASLTPLLYNDTFFRKIVHLCSTSKSTLIIVDLPAVKNKRIISKINLGVEMDENLRYFNMNTLENTSWIKNEEHWLGGSHLNQYGAEHFTSQFIDTLLLNQ